MNWIVSYELWVVNYEWWIMNGELWMVNYEWWIMNGELWIKKKLPRLWDSFFYALDFDYNYEWNPITNRK